jgi:uncharacterized protein DUF3883
MSAPDISFERLFSMPAFEGLRVLRIHKDAQPSLTTPDLIQLVLKVEPDAQSLDLHAAGMLLPLVDLGVPNDGVLFYRACISTVLLGYPPAWLRVLTQGRSRFLQKLGRDEQSLFRQAALLDDLPDEIVLDWWDRITGRVRLDGDQDRLELARRAERLTIEKEKLRLKELGIELKPIWMGLEDNFAGFDVQSYDPGDPAPTNLLIEVKSTVASPLRFILTRNEWNKAKDVGKAYCFHIWDMQKDPPILHVRSVAQVAPHIPADSEKGKWKQVEIPVAV